MSLLDHEQLMWSNSKSFLNSMKKHEKTDSLIKSYVDEEVTAAHFYSK